MTLATVRFKATLVGMRFHDVTSDSARAAVRGGISLRREPQNPHDVNAIAVMSGVQTLGHVDKGSAKRLAPLLDSGATWTAAIDSARSKTERSLPLVVTVTYANDVVVPPCPSICKIKTVGIYEVIVVPERKSYFGQSLDVQGRLKQHWEALANGLHANPELQRHWCDHGPTSFDVRLVEQAPSGLDDLELARWLVQRERHCIAASGGLRNVINAEFPKPVLNENARSILGVHRRRLKPEIDALMAQMVCLRARIAIAEDRVDELGDQVALAERWWGLLTSTAERHAAEAAASEILQVHAELSSARTERDKIQDRLHPLKQFLFL